MDRLDELAIFVRIVEEGSLARAAARLRRSPPAVTRALSALEARIGLRLIDRTTRRLAPSEAGRALYDKARAQPTTRPPWPTPLRGRCAACSASPLRCSSAGVTSHPSSPASSMRRAAS